jgi:hypothetical protein
MNHRQILACYFPRDFEAKRKEFIRDWIMDWTQILSLGKSNLEKRSARVDR